MIEPGVPLRQFTIEGWLGGMAKAIDLVPWPEGIAASHIEFEETATGAVPPTGEKLPRPLLPREASQLLLESTGLTTT